jgi:hypothetical protein
VYPQLVVEAARLEHLAKYCVQMSGIRESVGSENSAPYPRALVLSKWTLKSRWRVGVRGKDECVFVYGSVMAKPCTMFSG